MKGMMLVLLLIIALAALLYGCFKETDELIEMNNVVVGITLPLTGNYAAYGLPLKNGAVLAQEEINLMGGINGRKLELAFMDNQGDAKTVVSDVNYLIEIRNVSVILNAFEYLTLASMSIVEDKHMPMIAFTTHRLNKTSAVFTFRDSWDTGGVGESFGLAANKIGCERIVIFGIDDPSYDYLVAGVKKRVKCPVIYEDKFSLGQTDFRTNLLRIRQVDADVLIIYSYAPDVSRILRQMSELRMTSYKLIVFEGTDPLVLENKDILKATKAVTDQSLSLTADHAEFTEKYHAEFGEYPKPESLYIYEDMLLVADIMRNCDSISLTRECIQKGLLPYFDDDHNKYRELPLLRYGDVWEEFSVR